MQRGRQRGKSVTLLNCHFTWNNVCRLASISRKKLFLCLNMFLPEEVFLPVNSWQHCVYIFPSLHIPLCIWYPSQSRHTVFSETDERKWFIHQTRPRIQIPADLLIRWLILQIFLGAGARLRLLGLSAEHGTRVIISPVATLWQQTQTGLTSENEHITSPNSKRQTR